MNMNLSNSITVIHNLVTEYLNVKLQLVKLSILEKMAKIAIFLTSLVVVILGITIFFIFAAATFVVWYGVQYQDYLTGLIIVMGSIIVLIVTFILLRRKIFETFFLKTFSSILLDKEDEDE